jgi:malonyl-CoA/methylmalonyl-CoA synthetase
MQNIIRRITSTHSSSSLKKLYRTHQQHILIRHYSLNNRVPYFPLYNNAISSQSKIAIVESSNHNEFTYGQLLSDSGKVSTEFRQHERVCFLFDPGYAYVVYQWAIWRAGSIAVPLSNTHPTSELEYYIDDSQCTIVAYDSKFEELIAPLKTRNDIVFKSIDVQQLCHDSKASLHEQEYTRVENVHFEDDAMIIYTSGTTSKPKGVVSTHKIIHSQTECLVDAWKWTSSDRILHVLPLHHVHGVINCLTCALWTGATVEFVKFNAADVWKRFLENPQLSLFMAVPTIYVKMIHEYEKLDNKEKYSKAASRVRLMVCGSAALPEPILESWKRITGHTLLERYGMTEIGMALSNKYDDRRPGYVGAPLPGVQVQIVDEEELEVPAGEPGELLVKGDSVFKCYWRKPEATKQTFTADGWFKTGDSAVMDPKSGYYKILGRNSVDIIKHAGYKISALDIERAILSDDSVSECAVIGVPDEEYGQKIAAIVVLKDPSKTMELQELRSKLKTELAYYKLPSMLRIVDQLPRNAMGKVNKKDKFFTSDL